MDILLTDHSVRRAAQILILLYLMALIAALCGLLFIEIFQAWLDQLPEGGWFGALRDQLLVPLLTFPFRSVYSAIIPTFVSLFPIALARVCYEYTLGPPPKTLETRNEFGQVCLGVFVFIFLIGALDLLFYQVFRQRMDQIFADGAASARSVASAATNLSLVYGLQFLGMKPA